MHPRDQERCASSSHREHGTNRRLSTAKVEVPDLSLANLEVLDPCHPRTWILKNERGVFSGSKWLAVAFCGFLWLSLFFVLSLFGKVLNSGSTVAFSGSEWLNSSFWKNVM